MAAEILRAIRAFARAFRRSFVESYESALRRRFEAAVARNPYGVPILADTKMTQQIYASIGNSEHRLTQAEWANFADDFVDAIAQFADEIHGIWFSLPNEAYLNACVCLEVAPGEAADNLKAALAAVARKYRQDSIAWAVVAGTELL